MRTFRHSQPVLPADLHFARSAAQNWRAAAGAEKTRQFRENFAALKFYDWYCRVVNPEEETKLATSAAPTPAPTSKTPSNNPPSGHVTTLSHAPIQKPVVSAVKSTSSGDVSYTASLSKKVSGRGKAFLSAGAMSAKGTSRAGSRTGFLYNGKIHTPLEMQKLLGPRRLDWLKGGCEFVRY